MAIGLCLLVAAAAGGCRRTVDTGRDGAYPAHRRAPAAPTAARRSRLPAAALPAPPGATSEGTPPPPAAGTAATTREISRGRYLTERVAMCVECHTPRDEDGALLLDRKFQGAAMPVPPPPFLADEWALEAPSIAGMPSYSRQEAVRLLTRGIARSGQPPRPPMPPFRMKRRDAEAIYAYLTSLAP